MTNSDFDGSVRATLADVALQTPVPDGLTDRLIANAEAGRPVVTPLHPTRRRAGWTLPLLAAAAIVVVAGGALAVSNLADHRNQPKPPAAPTGTSTHAPTTPPRPVDSVPADFRAAAVSFRDPQHGDALGVGNCGGSAASCAVTLIATDDGGLSWHVLSVPPKLRSMLNPDDPSCATNGGVLGPCVDRVLFANDSDGYLFGLHEFYWTTDGGHAWHHAPQPPPDGKVPMPNNVPTMLVADGYAYRMYAQGVGSSGQSGRLQRAPIGTNHWTDISPADAGIYNSQIAATGNALYLEAGYYAGHLATELYESTDHGTHWSRVGPADGVVSAPDGAIAFTSGCRVNVAAAGHTFVEHSLPGNCDRAETYVGLASANELTVVADPEPEPTSRPLRLYHSSDGGASFQPVATIPRPRTGRVWFGMIGQFGYLAAPGSQVYLTVDGGRTWQARSF
jgi:photosystem II stability/assembly factor-like uncharacterized protein